MWSSERPSSLRAQLAWQLALTIGVFLGIALLVLDRFVDSGVYAHLDRALASQARTLRESLERSPQSPEDAPVPAAYALPEHTEFFALYDGRGRLVRQSNNSRGRQLPLPASIDAQSPYYDLRTPDGDRGRALVTDVVLHGRPHRLVVAAERAEWDASEEQIHRTLLITMAVTTALVVAMAVLLVSRAFRTLVRQGQRLEQLDPEAAPAPIGADLPDELRPFAAAIDTGVERLYSAIERERRFSRDIAHELRTPLAEIRASAEVALASDEAADLRTGLLATMEASERMQRSVDTLLSLARFDAGLEKPALDPLDLAALLSAQIERLRAAGKRRDVELEWRSPPEAWVHSDVGILERVFDNLLGNALEYSPAGSTVLCSLEVTPEGFVTRVENDAPDLVAADLAHFGSRFWRKADSAANGRHAGLGLALSEALARVLDLRLRFELRDSRLHTTLGPFAPL